MSGLIAARSTREATPIQMAASKASSMYIASLPKTQRLAETVCGAIPGRPYTLERHAPKRPIRWAVKDRQRWNLKRGLTNLEAPGGRLRCRCLLVA